MTAFRPLSGAHLLNDNYSPASTDTTCTAVHTAGDDLYHHCRCLLAPIISSSLGHELLALQ